MDIYKKRKQDKNHYLNFLVDFSFQWLNRSFVSAFRTKVIEQLI